jgi:outer membrane protein TolC
MRAVRVLVKARHAVLVAALFLVGAAAAAQPVAPVESDTTRAVRDVIETTREYRQALERVLGFRVQDVDRASTSVDQRRELYVRGIVSRREMETAERALDDARAKLAETQQEIAQADHALAEALVAAASPPVPPSPATPPSPEPGVAPGATPVFVRFRGPAPWSLADAPRLDRFFRERFGRALPVSAYGQTPVHDRLHLDHHQALDVALHPDSPEGAALLAFLRSAGVSFIAFRGAMAGAATGAHIHVGAPSPRTAALAPASTTPTP